MLEDIAAHPRELDNNEEAIEKCKDLYIRRERLEGIGKKSATTVTKQDLQAKIDEQKWVRHQQDLAQRLIRNQRIAEIKAKQAAESESRRLIEQEKKARRWKAVQSKIEFQPPCPGYYSRTPFKPGLLFFSALVQAAEQSRVKLQVNIPDMLLCHTTITWVRTEARFLRIIHDFKLFEFYRTFSLPPAGERTPVAVMRVTSEEAGFKSIPLSFAELSDTISKNQLPAAGLLQRFVKFNGTHPAIIRLFLINQTKDQRATHALSIFNKDETVKGSFHGRHLVEAEVFDAVDVVQLQGSTQLPYITYAKHIVEMLEGRFAVRIEEIVLDFIRDENDVIWLLGCQGFRIDESVLSAHDERTRLKESFSPIVINEYLAMEREQRLAEMHCKLCLMPFKACDVTNQLPYKTLLLFKERTMRKKKVPIDLSHLRVVSADYLTHSIRMCEICYCLVLAEIELMKAEMKLAEIMDVPYESYDVMNPKVYTHPSYLPARTHQWRLLLYFHSLELKQPLLNLNGFVIRYYLFGQWYSRPLPKHWNEGMNFAAMHYFFAAKSIHLRDTCHALDVKFEICPSLHSKKVALRTNTRIMKFFTFEMEDRSGIHQEFPLHMFDKDSLAGKLRIVVGLACDREISLRDLQSTITRFMSFYVPERSYFSSDQMPEEWMQMFSDDFKADLNSLVLDSSEEVDKMYSPALSERHFTPTKKRLQHTLPPSAAPSQSKPATIPSTLSLQAFSKPKLTLRSAGSTTSTRGLTDDFLSPTYVSPRQPSASLTRGISPIVEHKIDDSLDYWNGLIISDIDNFSTEHKNESTLEEEIAVGLVNSVEHFLKGKTIDKSVQHLKQIVKKPQVQVEPIPLVLDFDSSQLQTMTTVELLPRPSSSYRTHKRVVSAHREEGKEAKHQQMMRTYSSKGKRDFNYQL